MKCSDCQREMQVCLSSFYCDWCEGDIETLPLHEGYIVFTNNGMHSPGYVFKHISGARKWKDANATSAARLVKVLSPTPFRWKMSKGSFKNVEIARGIFHLQDDHKFLSGSPFVFRAPDDYKPKASAMPSADEKDEGDKLQDFFASSTNR